PRRAGSPTEREEGVVLRGDAVVLATGAWLPKLAAPLGVRTRVQAGRGYSFTVKTDEPVETPIYLPARRVACTPYQGRFRIAGTMEFRGPDEPLQPRRIEAILASVRHLFQGVDHDDRHDEWVGSRPVTPVGLPLVGATRPRARAPGHDGRDPGRDPPLRPAALTAPHPPSTGLVSSSRRSRHQPRARRRGTSCSTTGYSARGAYMMTATPTRHSSAPATSHRSGRKPSTTMPHASDPATNTPPYAARMRPKCASGWSVATTPYSPSATTPAPIHSHPRCSRSPCHTSHAPPISSSAASTNNGTERPRARRVGVGRRPAEPPPRRRRPADATPPTPPRGRPSHRHPGRATAVRRPPRTGLCAVEHGVAVVIAGMTTATPCSAGKRHPRSWQRGRGRGPR